MQYRSLPMRVNSDAFAHHDVQVEITPGPGCSELEQDDDDRTVIEGENDGDGNGDDDGDAESPMSIDHLRVVASSVAAPSQGQHEEQREDEAEITESDVRVFEELLSPRSQLEAFSQLDAMFCSQDTGFGYFESQLLDTCVESQLEHTVLSPTMSATSGHKRGIDQTTAAPPAIYPQTPTQPAPPPQVPPAKIPKVAQAPTKKQVSRPADQLPVGKKIYTQHLCFPVVACANFLLS